MGTFRTQERCKYSGSRSTPPRAYYDKLPAEAASQARNQSVSRTGVQVQPLENGKMSAVGGKDCVRLFHGLPNPSKSEKVPRLGI